MSAPTHYYNEIDPYCAAWLQNLMDAGEIPRGVIDTRSIEDVTPADLAGFTQCHFFAGLGGWPLALRIAGWQESRPAWTGSCPCQPFSAAGKGAGFADERHLWPAWQHLIAQCRPAVVFGEQVASKAVDAWIYLVHADMEGMGYAFGCVPFPSAGVGAPHIRDRTYWVADADSERLDGQQIRLQPGEARFDHAQAAWGSGSRRLADADGRNASAERQQRGGEQRQQPQDGDAGWVADAASTGRRSERTHGDSAHGFEALRAGQAESGRRSAIDAERAGPTNGQWRAADWLACTDGKWRPVEPGTFPLAHGIPNRVGRLRAYGNAINPHQAAEFVIAFVESEIFL